MHRLFLSLVALVGLIALSTSVSAQELALKRVMLSSGGLGYFEYEAVVEGDATLRITVPLQQVDDVLKSLVVYDDTGAVGGLSLPGREPLEQLFKDLPFDRAALDSPGQLLSALKGAEVAVGGSRATRGRIVSVQQETVALHDGQATTTRTRITLLTDQGLQQFILEDADNLQFADPALRDRIGQALLAIQANREKDTRTLELQSRGQGRRTVRVAYIVEAPVWKASYRLTLAADAAAPRAALQGWAVVENLSGQDWKDVELTLASGRPVAFRQALYEAYYVTRPEVPVEVAGRLMPGLDRGGVPLEQRTKSVPPPPPPPSAPAPGRPMQERAASVAAAPFTGQAAAFDAAQAGEAATHVTFRFPHGVSVANGRTLSLPIIAREAPVEQLALYQPETAARNPLAALRLHNDGDSGLPPGIITVYQRDKSGAPTYVGDARLSGLPAGDSRLLPYAVDEKIVVEHEAGQTERLANGTIADGALRFSRVLRQTATYRVKNASREPRNLIVVQRRLPGWTLVQPAASSVELSEGKYRIPFHLTGDEQTQAFDVVQEQTQHQEVRLLEGAGDQIRVYAQAREFDDATRQALERILKLQADVAAAERKVTQADAQREQIVREQARLRDNLSRVPPNSDLQRRYLATLDRQESELEAIAKRHADAEKEVEAARQALRGYVAQLG
jgi:hypothetical protein